MKDSDVNQLLQCSYLVALRWLLQQYPWDVELDPEAHPHDINRLRDVRERIDALRVLIDDKAAFNRTIVEFTPRQAAA